MTGAQSRSVDEVLASTVVRVMGRGGAVCGAGALVAPDLVVTCAHVVSDALGRPRQETVAAGAVLTVDFPLAGTGANETEVNGTGANGTGARAAAAAEAGARHDDTPPPARTATVEHWIPTRPDRTGDIAVLRLPEPVPSTSPLPMADPDTVWEHGARAVGFPGGEPGEMWFRGRFSGATSEGWIQLSRADGQSAHVRRGFSGTPVWDNELGAAVGLVVAAQPEQDAQQAFVLSTRTLLREVPALAAVLSPAPPFRGLATFQESDADVYFGRDDDIDEVVRALRGEHRTVTLYGPSGSGKSSLALAGVAPRMRQAGYDVLVVNAGRIASPRAALATELYERIRSGRYGLPARASGADQVETWLASLGLADALHRATGSASGRLLIVLDQAEALLDRTDDELAQAADLLFPAHPGPGARVLLTLRSDFMDATLKHPRLGPALRCGATLPLTPMSREQLREVVVRPLERVPAVAYDPGLERRILDDAGGEPGILPLLGFVLEQLWERRATGRLRSAAYEEMGGVRGALELHSERAWREIVGPGRTDDERTEAEGTEAEALRLLTGLVRVHPGSETPLRRRLTRQEAGEERWAVARAFAERRLLVLHGGEEEPQTAELAHEALVTAWPALRRQVRADGEFLAGRAELVHDRRRWERGGRTPDLLPGPRQLAATEHWLGGRERELSEREREFLALARRRHRARRTRLRAAWTAAALVLALIAGLGTFLVYQSHVSDQRRAEARSRALASMSRDLTGTDPGQAALAAIAAYDIAPTQEARSALLRRYDQFKDADWVLTGVQGKIEAVAMSPDGAVTLVTTKEGRATLYVRSRGRVLRTPLRLPDKARGPMVSRDGRRIAYLGAKDGTLFWHDVDPAARDVEHLLKSARRIDGEGAFKADTGLFAGSDGMAALSPSGARAVAVDDGGRLWLWDLGTKARRQLPPSGPKVEAVWYGPDENTLVTQRPGPSLQESTMVAADIATGKTRQLAERASTDGNIAQLGLSGDGGVLVVCRAGATVSTPVYQAVRVADGRQIHRHTATAPCHGLAIDRTGERYAVFQGGGWHLVETRPGGEVKPLFGPRIPSLTNMRLLGREPALTMVAWEDNTAVTGWRLGMDTTHIPSTPVLLDSGDKMLAHVGSKGEQLVLMDTAEGSFDGPGPPRRLAEVTRDPATAPQPPSDLKINRAETLLADLVGRTTVMIRDTTTLREVARISTAEPPLKEGKPEQVEYVFTADDELVTVSGSLVEHWNARTGKRLSRPFEVGDAGISEDRHPKFRLFRHPAPGHLQVIISGDPVVHAVDLRTGREDKALSLTLGPDVTDAGFDRSGRYAAVRTGGDMVELWSLRPGRKPEKVYGPIGPLKQFDDYKGGFVGDSSEFLLANDNSIRFVQASDPGQVRSYDFDTSQTFVAAPKDAKVLLRAGQDGRVDLLRFDPGRWKARVCEVLGRDVDPEERRILAGGLPKRVCPAPAG